VKTVNPKTETIKTRLSEKMKAEFEECLMINEDTQSEVLRKCVSNYIRATKRKD